jgi:hypothetical protein
MMTARDLTEILLWFLLGGVFSLLAGMIVAGVRHQWLKFRAWDRKFREELEAGYSRAVGDRHHDRTADERHWKVIHVVVPTPGQKDIEARRWEFFQQARKARQS